jgi:predicted NBD/HSP70 family sugar kinase
MSDHALWGIDLGGTKIEGVVLESKTNPQVLSRKRIATEGDKGYSHVLSQINQLVRSLSDDVGAHPQQIGVGTPGAIDAGTGLLRGSNSQHLNYKPVNVDLESILGIPVAIENDANCFALAETRLGAVLEIAPAANVVFGVIMGTGVGGGVVVEGNLISGRNFIAGEWGHNYLDASGGDCYCGRSGCVETILSGPGLEKYYTSLAAENQPLDRIVKLASAGDGNASKTMDRLIAFFGLGLASVINILDPEVIVLGGGVGNIDLLYTRGVEEVAKNIFAPKMQTRIIRPSLGDSAGVFGAAYLFET